MRKTLSNIAEAVGRSVSAYDFADLSVALEIVARSCEITGNSDCAATVRQLITYPKMIEKDNEAHYTDARQVRMNQFERALADANGSRGYRESPVTMLRELIDRHSRKGQNKDRGG